MRDNKAYLIFFLLVITGFSVFSQATTNSPYSKYGIGIIRPSGFSQNFAMGGVGIGLRSDRDINLQNPASYSNIVVTSFDFGFTNNALWLDDGTESQYQNNPYINNIAFAFPAIKDIWGMSFGILPYANTGYLYDNVINDSIAGNVNVYNEGEGAVNKVFLGNGFAINIDTTSLIAFGANTSFLFGHMNYDERMIYGEIPSGINIWRTKEISLADFNADFGLQYKKTFIGSTNEDKYKLTLGATYALAADLNSKRTELIRTFTGSVDYGVVKDTASFIDNVDDVVQLPSEMGFGISFEKEKKWLLGIDFKSANWSAIENNNTLYSFKSNYSLGAGFQIIPKNMGRYYIQRLIYRLGVRYNTSYLLINDVDWNEYGITFGIGLPIRRAENSFPRLNIGIEYGERGTLKDGLIKEKFINFNVGIAINALWFQKRKYD